MDEKQGIGRARGRGRALVQSLLKKSQPAKKPISDEPQQLHSEMEKLSTYKESTSQPSSSQQARSTVSASHVIARGRATINKTIMPQTAKISETLGMLATDEIGRGGIRGRRIINNMLRTKPQNINCKQGSSGREISLQANYFRLIKKPEWTGLYQYHVAFSPDIEITRIRQGLIRNHKPMLGGFLFDGTMLFITKRLNSDTTELLSVNNSNDEKIRITVKFVGLVSMTDAMSLQILNLIMRKSMDGLKLQLVGRNFFDALANIKIREFNLELWPGYETSIRQHEKDVLLCVEVVHKVMRTDKIIEILYDCTRNQRDYKDAFVRQIIGTVVLTDYNNKTYRIDDVDFKINPSSTFETKNGPISFYTYYKNRYNIEIRDLKQPMLLSRAKARDIRAGQAEIIALVPELCRATGINDNMRQNFQLMKAMADHTRVTPELRIKKLLEFNNRLAKTEASVATFDEWEMKLDKNLVQIKGRELKTENIILGKSSVSAGDKSDWTRALQTAAMYNSVDLGDWFCITTNRMQRETKDFLSQLLNVARGLQFRVREPVIIVINDDRSQTYITEIEKCANRDPQMIMCVLPNNRSDRYSAIKKKCYVDRSIPSQIMVQRTITPRGGNTRGLMSIATKVAIQMNCKLGGAPWMVELPLSGLMTIGFDVCHDTNDKSKSFGALVATMDLKKSAKYFSAISAHTNGEELSNQLTINVTKALKQYRNLHGVLPLKILFYRDGVGEGQTHYVFEHEVNILKEKLNQIYKSSGNDAEYKLAYVIVSKRIRTRLFTNGRNPRPGTVVDDTITCPEKYDFFLVSQCVNQGTVSPSSYSVIHDNMGLDPDKMQILTYKMTHLYYNWSGTTRVPAVCQYAHKLAFLVAEYIHQSPSNQLDTKLYFL